MCADPAGDNDQVTGKEATTTTITATKTVVVMVALENQVGTQLRGSATPLWVYKYLWIGLHWI